MMARLLLVFVLVAAAAAQQYSSRYDNINLDEILTNDRLLKGYFNCLMDSDEKRCTPDGKELKSVLLDAIQTDCSKCTEKQRSGAEYVLRFLYDKKKDMLDQLEAKYDPDGTFRRKHEEEIKKATNNSE